MQNTVESGNSSFFPLGSSDSEGNFETPEAETPIRSPLKESCESSLGLARPGAKTQESQEANEQLVTEVVNKCSSEACSGSSGSEIPQLATDAHLVRDVREEPGHDTSKISVVRPFSIEAKNSSDIPAALRTEAAHDCVTAVSGEALPSSTPGATQEEAVTEGSMGVTLEAAAEGDLNAGNSCPEPVASRSKLKKPKPVSLRKKTIGEFSGVETTTESRPLARVSYQSNPDDLGENMLGGDGSQRLPSGLKEASDTLISDMRDSGDEPQEEARSSPLKLEFDFTEDLENVEAKKALPRKLGRKPGSKLTPKKQKDGIHRPVGVEQPADLTARDAPPSQASSKLEPSPWDQPSFSSLGSHSALQSSPPLSSKGSYHFDPDNFDESMDPFKPTATLTSSNFCSSTGNHVNEILESPKKAKSRLITSG